MKCVTTMVRPFAAFLTLLAASLICLPAQAQWKWRDKAGHVQYSDLPPPVGTPDQDILIKPTPGSRHSGPVPNAPVSIVSSGNAASAAASGALVPRTGDSDLEAARKKAEAETAAKSKAEEQRIAGLKADNCARAKTQLTTLESGIRLARANAKGEREFIDDKQRADETKRTKDVISTDCK
ncbi:MAG: DUF4124 domain-containing protein [Caldimonas sp.]